MRIFRYVLGTAIVTALFAALPLTAQAARLDTHSGMMAEGSPLVQAYNDQACTDPIHHWLFGGDWYKVTGNGSYDTTINVEYPLTAPVQGDTNSSTYTNWFKGPGTDGFAINADSGTGYFTFDGSKTSWNTTTWYNRLPVGDISYVDEHAGGDGQLTYVSVNDSFTVNPADPNGNKMLYLTNEKIKIMYAAGIADPAKYGDQSSGIIYNHPDDFADADYHWTRASKAFSAEGLVQGLNYVFYAGTDAAANYMLGSTALKYDTVAPTATYSPSSQSTPVSSIPVTITPSDPGADNNTGSGVKQWRYAYSYDGGNSWDSWSAWIPGSTKSTTVTIGGSGAAGTMEIKTEVIDNAGNIGTAISGQYFIGGNGSPSVGFTADPQAFHVNTDVIITTTVTNTTNLADIWGPFYGLGAMNNPFWSYECQNAENITPDHPITVSARSSYGSMPVGTQTVSALPDYNSEKVWFKWHTPSTPGVYPVTFTVSTYDNEAVGGGTMYYTVVADNEIIPPDPTATDQKPNGFLYDNVPGNSNPTTASWSTYYAREVMVPVWVAAGYFVVEEHYPLWEFGTVSYHTSATSSLDLKPDPHDATYTYANGQYTMKSGYGINNKLSTSVNTTSSQTDIPISGDAYYGTDPVYSTLSNNPTTGFQAVREYFPEFEYQTYFRKLETLTSGLSATFDFKPNLYSQYQSHIHFLPVWYDDNQLYTPYTLAYDAWTPGGDITSLTSASIMIKGNLFQDYRVGPEDPNSDNTNQPNVYAQYVQERE